MKKTRPNLIPALLLILASIAVCSLQFTLEQLIKVNYLISTPTKIVLFLGLIWSYHRWIFLSGRRRPANFLSTKRIMPFKGLAFGLISFASVGLAYYLLKGNLDLEGIKASLIAKNNISASNYIFVALYIILGNSLLEEVFFRGFIYNSLKDLGYEKTGVVFSAFLFSCYHLAIFATWFTLPYMALALLGLFLGGLIFIFLNRQYTSVLNSWIAHALADLAIISIGFIMFYT